MNSKKNRTSILMIEPHADGHRGPYLQWMATGLSERGVDVIILTLKRSLDHPAIKTLADERNKNGKEIQVIPCESHGVELGNGKGMFGLIASELRYWRLFNAWYTKYADNINPDHVFVPYLDYCLYAIGLLGSPFGKCLWSALSMRPSFHYKKMHITKSRSSLSRIKEALFKRVTRNATLHCLLTNDETLYQYCKNKNWNKKLALFPDPTDQSNPAERSFSLDKLGLRKNRKFVLVYGSITLRKGVAELLRAMASLQFPEQLDVVIAGKLAPEVQYLLKNQKMEKMVKEGRIHLINRIIDRTEETLLFSMADIIWLGYREHYGSSGVLAQAASSGKPVLACKDGLIGWRTARHGLGEVVDTTKPESVIDAIYKIMARDDIDTTSSRYDKDRMTWRPPSITEAQNTLAQILRRHDIGASTG